jgi:hypothetical protein
MQEILLSARISYADQIISTSTPPEEELMLEIIRNFYNRIRFKALDNMQKPFIFAYS